MGQILGDKRILGFQGVYWAFHGISAEPLSLSGYCEDFTSPLLIHDTEPGISSKGLLQGYRNEPCTASVSCDKAFCSTFALK